jgi:hypothetical protein
MISRLRFSRRQIFIGGSAFTALGTGTAYIGSADANDLFKAMVHHELPGVKVSDATIRAFAEDIPIRYSSALRVLSMGCRMVGYGAVVAALGQHFRRKMFTRFLLTTDFFQLPDPRAAELHYIGKTTACGNPFAQFSRS